ncbi:MAG: alpha-amylase/4-alpha-glucanotransferase domain-containing protein [Candidatus Acidiferrales bacterium]
MPKFHLVLLIHSHQPVGNFDDVFERAYAQSYSPFLEAVFRHPGIRIGLHYSGPLLEWIEHRKPEFFDRLRQLVERGQIEMVGGGFYEPILISIPSEDRTEQIVRLSDYIEKQFGRRPNGAWLAERVWEAPLPGTLAGAGIEYTLVDDNHFFSAGCEPNQMYGYYLTEDVGATVKVIPGLQSLRYLIPFRGVDETVDSLRRFSREYPGGMAAMGDDCEKFGIWPGTNDHCYRDGWLENFFSSLERNSDWLAVTPPGEYLETNPPLGRASLPSASYMEMTEWALPTAARQRFHAISQEFSSRPDVLAFLRGGPWRNFMTKYSEVNLLHKKMLHVSKKLRELVAHKRRGPGSSAALSKARTELLSAQCNDAYWHGVFGGLYAPHLRTVLWNSLVTAETLIDGVVYKKKPYAEADRMDFDLDGREEIYFTSDRYAALICPADGGTLSMLDFRPAGITLINSIARRPEAYHSRLKELAARTGQGQGGAVSIHEQVLMKEKGLDRLLQYDRWDRHAFRLLLFAEGKSQKDYQKLGLNEDAAIASGNFDIITATPTETLLRLRRDSCNQPGINSCVWNAEKVFTFAAADHGFEVACDVTVSHNRPETLRGQIGIESVVNLLAPNVPDRYFESAGQRHELRWSAATPASSLTMTDEWQKVSVTIGAPEAREFWISPIDTVSESEEGFERVYQGSQILAVWPIELAPGAAWTGRLVLKISPLT